MFKKLRELFGWGGAQTFSPLSIEEKVKRDIARILRTPSHRIRDDMRLGEHAEEVCLVLTFSLDRTVHTHPSMTVGELIAQLQQQGE